jgi:hypothetical protein
MDLTKFYQEQIYTFITSVSVKMSQSPNNNNTHTGSTEQMKIIVVWDVKNTTFHKNLLTMEMACVLQNVGTYLQNYMTSHPRRQ